jgi:glycerophosphoryl diester phosphodiesterase
VLFVVLAACTAGSDTSPAESSPTTTVADSSVPPASLDVQGHRGARGLQPENTLPAFEAALDLGVDTLELDLHFTADGQIVVWHDPVIQPDKCRLDPDRSADADPPSETLSVAGLTRRQLAAYRCDLNPDAARFPDQQPTATPLAGDSYQIVTLNELFDFVAAYSEAAGKTDDQRTTAAAVAFNVETKRVADRPETINDGFDGTNPGPFETTLLDLIAQRGLEDRVVVQSFDHRSLRAIRTVNTSVRLAALTGRNVPFSDEFAEFAVIWSPDYRSLSGSSLDDAHAAGLQVIPWTVNETSDMARLIDLGVDGLITDRPDLLVELLSAR